VQCVKSGHRPNYPILLPILPSPRQIRNMTTTIPPPGGLPARGVVSPELFPALETLDLSTSFKFSKPVKKINDGPDVPHFLTSKGYRDIGLFVMQLNRALCPRKVTGPDGKEVVQTWRLPAAGETSKGATDLVRQLQSLLAKAEAIIEEAPPDPGPRRFGNISFRKWHEILGERAPSLIEEFLPQSIREFSEANEGGNGDGPVVELQEYFLGGFGSSQRLDYGTGHELSFVAFLGCLWKLGAFKDGTTGDIERSIVFDIIEP
jgi:serine/threonine-protein phosphatase 2A activator